MPSRTDAEQVASLVGGDADFVDALLGHEAVFERLISDEQMLLSVSPQLFFSVLLVRARRDLGGESYTMERRQSQKVAIFDAPQAASLLNRRPVRDYLAEMLASFTRVQGFSRRVRVRKGVWYRQRFNELDVDSLIRHCNAVEEEHRFQIYRRIADACLFLAGMFPEYIQAQSCYPCSDAPRPAQGRMTRSIEDYEREGRTFYELAAGHQDGRASRLSGALAALADKFTLAEKPLAYIADRYLQVRKKSIFGA